MEKTGRFTDRRRHLTLLFVLVFLLFDWPLLTIPFKHGMAAAFVYLFFFWSLLVLVLFFAARHIAARAETKPPAG